MYPRAQIQCVMSVWPVVSVTVLLGQLVHVELATAPTSAEYVCRPQSRHVEGESAATVAEYLPAPQSVQVLASVAAVFVEYLPAAQSEQVALPFTGLNLPAAHATHVPPSGPVYPR